MTSHSLKRDGAALAIAIITLILGLIAVWISKDSLNIRQTSNDLYYAALIFAPILVYAIASGRIKQFKAGGLEAEFADIAEQQIEPSPILLFEKKAIETEKGRLSDLDYKIKNIRKQFVYESQKNKVVVLTLFLGIADQATSREESNISSYRGENLLRYIERLSKIPSFKLVVILDKYKKVKAYITFNKLQSILLVEDDNNGICNEYINDRNQSELSKSIVEEDSHVMCREFINAMNQGDLSKLIEIPGIITTTIQRDNSKLLLKLILDMDKSGQ
jgi:hypothetical protein